jgi:hypothetical protein
MIGTLVILILLLPTYTYADTACYADNGFDNYTMDYLKNMEKTKASVFYSECKSIVDKKQYTATLLLSVGNNEGLLIEKEGNTAVNLATVLIDKNSLRLGETNGGVWSYNRVDKLITELAHYKFRLISPFKVNAMKHHKINNVCKNAAPPAS